MSVIKSNFYFRGIVHCLKLSPNLRRQAPAVKTALLSKYSEDKIFRLKTKVLSNILEMVVKPEAVKKEIVESCIEEYEITK